MKKILRGITVLFFLCAILCVGVLPVSARTDEEDPDGTSAPFVVGAELSEDEVILKVVRYHGEARAEIESETDPSKEHFEVGGERTGLDAYAKTYSVFSRGDAVIVCTIASLSVLVFVILLFYKRKTHASPLPFSEER